MPRPKLSLSTGMLPQYSVYVYAVIDVSLSMKGFKLEEVCESLGNLITASPDDTLFDITLFSVNSTKIMCSVKTLIDVPMLMQTIVNSCGLHCTNRVLFDAWGDVINSIPQSVMDNNEVQILVLTDGEDNGSKRYTHQSVMELTESKIASLMTARFNFVNVGKDINAGVINSLNKMIIKSEQVQAITTDDSAIGIKMAMKRVHADIMLSTMRSAYRTVDNKSTGNPRVATPFPNSMTDSPFGHYDPTVAKSKKMFLNVPSFRKGRTTSETDTSSTASSSRMGTTNHTMYMVQ